MPVVTGSRVVAFVLSVACKVSEAHVRTASRDTAHGNPEGNMRTIMAESSYCTCTHRQTRGQTGDYFIRQRRCAGSFVIIGIDGLPKESPHGVEAPLLFISSVGCYGRHQVYEPRQGTPS